MSDWYSTLMANHGVRKRLWALMAQSASRAPGFRGKQRLLRAADKSMRAAAGAARLTVVQGGVRFAVDTRELIDFNIAYHGGFGQDVVRLISAALGPGPAVIWDIGANVGAVSLALAQRGADTRIEAFEPSPKVLARLRENLALNPKLAARITLHEGAVTDCSGPIEFFESGEDLNSGIGSLGRAPNTAATPLRVPGWRGDDLIARGVAAPGAIKIDVEGFEYEVLCGLEHHLTTRGAVVVFEWEQYRVAQRPPEKSAIRWFREHGYGLGVLRPDGTERPLPGDDPGESADIVARPEKNWRPATEPRRRSR